MSKNIRTHFVNYFLYKYLSKDSLIRFLSVKSGLLVCYVKYFNVFIVGAVIMLGVQYGYKFLSPT